VQSFYLNIKDTVGVKGNAVIALYILCKALLVFQLNLCKLCKNLAVVFKHGEFGQLHSIFLEVRSYRVLKE